MSLLCTYSVSSLVHMESWCKACKGVSSSKCFTSFLLENFCNKHMSFIFGVIRQLLKYKKISNNQDVNNVNSAFLGVALLCSIQTEEPWMGPCPYCSLYLKLPPITIFICPRDNKMLILQAFPDLKKYFWKRERDTAIGYLSARDQTSNLGICPDW